MTPSRHRTVAALCAVVAILLIVSGCVRDTAGGGPGGGDDPQVLVFASVPSDRPANQVRDQQPIIEMLKKETGKEIRFQIGTDYDAIIRGLVDEKIDIADLGPYSYVLAKVRGARITVVATRVDKKGDQPGYYSYGFTRAGSPIQNLADFRGKRVCFGDRDSTSGYLYPVDGLLKEGIDPEKDIIPVFAGRHDASVLAVANGQCDAGFALDRIVERQLIEQGLLQPEQIHMVWKSPERIPGPPLVIANHLDSELTRQLTILLQSKANADYLRENGFCQGECAIADGFAYGYQPAADADYDVVRDLCRKINSCVGG